MLTDRNSKNKSYTSQLAILIGVTGAGIILSVILSFIIWLIMVGVSFPKQAGELFKPQYYAVNMVLQSVSTFCIFFLPVYFFAMICYKKPFKYLGYNLHINFKQVLLVTGILLITFPLSGSLAELNKILPIPQSWALKFKAAEDARELQESALIQITSLSKYFISMFIVALLPAIFEETFFRAGVQNLLTRWFKSPWAAIIITGIIFSLIHISYYGFLVRLGLGVILGLIFYYSKSIWLNILLHFLFNGVQVTVLYIFTKNGMSEKKDIESDFPVWLGIFALFVLIYLFMHFKKTSQKELEKYPEDKVSYPEDFDDWVNITS